MLVKIVFLIYSMQYVCNSQYRMCDIVRKISTENFIPRLKTLKGGLSSPGVYEFKNDGKDYVLRLSHPNRPILERKRTIKCYELAQKMVLLPP